MRGITKSNSSKWSKTEVSFQERLFFFLLWDLAPTLIMMILFTFCTSLVAEKIHNAKASHSIRVVKNDAHQ